MRENGDQFRGGVHKLSHTSLLRFCRSGYKRQEDSEPRAVAKLSHPPFYSNDQDKGSCFCKLWRKRKLSPSIMRMWLRWSKRSKSAAVICSFPKTCVHWANARLEVRATLARS